MRTTIQIKSLEVREETNHDGTRTVFLSHDDVRVFEIYEVRTRRGKDCLVRDKLRHCATEFRDMTRAKDFANLTWEAFIRTALEI